MLKITVNDKSYALDVPQSRYLAEVLRYDIGLKGTKIGCNESECGICSVILNGEPINSCIFPAYKAQGAVIETIEGLASKDGSLHPLQQAFLEHGATQCGICTPGVIMTAKALLERNQTLGIETTEQHVRAALKDTACRCTGYQSIINAILQVAGKKDSKPYLPEVKQVGFAVGQPFPNPDAYDKITGQAVYTDDLEFPGMLFAQTKRAGIAHGLIKKIDISAAEKIPGVRAVLTHADVPGRKHHGLVVLDWPVLCWDRVRYCGDAVAIVAADRPEIAAAAIEAIKVEYEQLPSIDTSLESLAEDALNIHPDNPDGNLIKHIKVRKGDIEAGFEKADIIIDRTYRTPCTEHAFLEPECSIGVPKGYTAVGYGGTVDPDAKRGVHFEHNKTTVYVGSQIPYQDRMQVAASLGVADNDIRIVATKMGGGFGGKEDIMGQIHVALLAEKTSRPVKMLYNRRESLLTHPKRHATIIRLKTGATKDGKLVASQAELYGDGGAYASLSEKVMGRATSHATGPYAIANVKVDCFAVYTTNPPAGAFRGFGVTQACFAAESNMDILAEELNMDPIQLRRINALEVGQSTSTGQTLIDSCGLMECINHAERDIKAHHEARGESFRWSWRDQHLHYAWGFAAAYKNTGFGGGAPDKSSVVIELGLDARGLATAEVRTTAAELGQGLPAVLSAFASEVLGIPYERIKVLLGDTDYCPDGGATTASRQTYVTGNATRHAALKARAILAGASAKRLRCAPEEVIFDNEQLSFNGTDISLAQVITDIQENMGTPILIDYEYWAPKTQPLEQAGRMHFAFGFGVMAALCVVDSRTGKTKVLKVITANDVGRVINPLTLEGQIDGGIVMGLGNALTEHYIMENGRPWTDVYAKYSPPRITDAPEIISRFVEHPTVEGPYGAKGVGELCSIPISPAITNAICKAVGVRAMSLPVDQDVLLRAMKNEESVVDMGWGDKTPIPALTAWRSGTG